MIGQLKPYAEYKDAGHQWLGEIPSHWNIASLGSLTWPVAKRGRTDLPLLSVVRERGVIPRSTMTDAENHNFVPDDLSNYKLARAGSLVINKMKAWQGSLGIAPLDGIVSPAYFVFHFNIADTRYGQALLRSRTYVAFFARVSDGVRIGQWDLSIDGMKRIPVPIPPVPEQASIVRFLDHSDRQIRNYIRVKKKLIALLNEQKHAAIHHAVTRGLNSEAPDKPSGVPWLNGIPQHWNVWQLGHFARVGNGSTPSRGNSAYWVDGTYPWLNSSSVNRSPISSSDQFVTELALRECHLPRVPPASVLVAITGQGKTRGTAAVLETEATINQHIAYITPRREVVSAEYLQLALVGAYRELRSISNDSGSTKGALTCADISHFKIALPDLDEQDSIIRAVRFCTHSLETAIARGRREVELLSEYRARLVEDVVLGRVDIRGVAVHLPAAPTGEEDRLDDDAADSEVAEGGDTEAEQFIA